MVWIKIKSRMEILLVQTSVISANKPQSHSSFREKPFLIMSSSSPLSGEGTETFNFKD